MRCANLVNLEVFVAIRPRLDVLKRAVLLQSFERLHVTHAKVLDLSLIEETISEEKAVL